MCVCLATHSTITRYGEGEVMEWLLDLRYLLTRETSYFALKNTFKYLTDNTNNIGFFCVSVCEFGCVCVCLMNICLVCVWDLCVCAV